jgi:hypothetical protein
MIAPFRPPDVEERGRKARKLPGIKIVGGRIRNTVQETPIMNITRDNLLWFNQIRKVVTDQQLTKPQLVGTH